MPRQRSFGAYLALSVLWLIIAVSRAYTMIGQPTRWVDILMVMASTMIAGVFFARAIATKRASAVLPPDIPGEPPNVPK